MIKAYAQGGIVMRKLDYYTIIFQIEEIICGELYSIPGSLVTFTNSGYLIEDREQKYFPNDEDNWLLLFWNSTNKRFEYAESISAEEIGWLKKYFKFWVV
jgi:hypothetical protein